MGHEAGQTDIVITIKTMLEVKVTVTQKLYTTLRHPKMHPHIKFGIPTSKNKGDMRRTRSGTDGQCDYYMSHCQNSSKFLSVSYLMKTADVIMNFSSSHNTTDHT